MVELLINKVLACHPCSSWADVTRRKHQGHWWHHSKREAKGIPKDGLFQLKACFVLFCFLKKTHTHKIADALNYFIFVQNSSTLLSYRGQNKTWSVAVSVIAHTVNIIFHRNRFGIILYHWTPKLQGKHICWHLKFHVWNFPQHSTTLAFSTLCSECPHIHFNTNCKQSRFNYQNPGTTFC